MRSARPHGMVAFYVGIGGYQPGFVIFSGGFLRVMDGHHHGTEKWRLRARQIVSAIRIEQGAVVFDLEEKIVDHSAREVQPSIAQKTADNEIAIPSVHFIEAAAGNNVFILEVEEAGWLKGLDIGGAEFVDDFRQVLDLNRTVVL